VANEFIKPEVVVGAVLGALQRDIVLPQLVWVDPGGDFKGAKNDTITLSIPAVTSSRKRAMRSGTTRTRDHLSEGKVSLTLDTNLYKDIEITDEELTLDINDFGRQVLRPISTSMAEGWEEEIADTMDSASYAQEVVWDDSDPHGVFADCGLALDLARVPTSGRFIALGSRLANAAIKSDQLRRYDSAGDSAGAALKSATVTALAGFDRIVTVPGLDPDAGYAFHRTAYAASSKVPVVPAGVAWGTSMASNGFAMRAIRQFDGSADGWVDILGFDAFVGSGIVEDHGEFGDDGRWVPAAEPDNDDGTDLEFIRAVKITGGGS
jgi:hypothetical protein